MIDTERKLALTFSGRTALVTGAASGIGAAVSAVLAEAGVRVIALDRAPAAPETGEDLVIPVAADVEHEQEIADALAANVTDTGLAYVVNCAGILLQSGFLDSTTEDWRKTLDVNLLGAFLCTRAALPWLKQADAAAVVNTTSLEGERVLSLVNADPTPHYAAAKAGLEMLTKSAARTLAEHGVRVNAIAPGVVATPMATQNHHSVESEMPSALKARVPLQRYATAREIAYSIAFLLSDQAAYITGSSLLVDGGFSVT